MVFVSGDGETHEEVIKPLNTPYEGTVEGGCNPKARVFVDGEEVPFVDKSDDNQPGIEIHATKGGNGTSDIVRYSDVIVPIEWGGKEIVPVTNFLRARPKNAPNVRIELQDPGGDYHTCHTGYLRAVGPKGENAVLMTVADYADLFSAVGFSGEYGTDGEVQVATMLRDIIETVTENHGAIDELPVETNVERLFSTDSGTAGLTSDLQGTPLPVTGTAVAELANRLSGFGPLASSFTFERDRDSCADAMTWLCNRIGADWWVDYSHQAEETVLVVDGSDSAPTFRDVRVAPDYSLLDGGPFESPFDDVAPILLEENNSLYQLSPVHTLQGRGRSESSHIAGFVKRESGEYPIATVVHDDLREMVGEIGQIPQEAIPSNSLEETINETKEELKKRIREAAGGEMIAAIEPRIRPPATIQAKPVCNSDDLDEFPMIEYQAEEVIHRVVATHPDQGEQRGSRTIIRCGIKCQDEDLSTIEPTGFEKI